MKKDIKENEKVKQKNDDKEIKEQKNSLKTQNHQKEPEESIKMETPRKTKIYISYSQRVVICSVLVVLFFAIGSILLSNSFSVSEEKITSYSEQGNLDYKVYLKPNDFYETEYLGKDMSYIASLIDDIDLSFNYQFAIDEPVNMNLGYRVYADLKITDSSEGSVYFEKKYNISEKKQVEIKGEQQYFLTEKVSIDYDEYNQLANDFRSMYGLDSASSLTVYMEFDKDISNLENKSLLNNSSQMSLKIPLSQKALNITINDTGINKSDKIIIREKMTFDNTTFAVISIILYLLAAIALFKLLKLLSLLAVKKTAYDKYVEKVLKEYDRLIVETKSQETFEGKNIIKIERIEEMLDARDSLKLPILYRNIVKHQKCYFYIKHEDNVYLMTVKASDIEVAKNKKD